MEFELRTIGADFDELSVIKEYEMTEKELKQFVINDSDFGHSKDYSEEKKMKIASGIIRKMKREKKAITIQKMAILVVL